MESEGYSLEEQVVIKQSDGMGEGRSQQAGRERQWKNAGAYSAQNQNHGSLSENSGVLATCLGS